MRGYYLTFVFVVLMFAASASSIRAQTLWGASEYGATIEQTRKAFPTAKAPAKGSTLGDGSAELLRLENIDLVNEKFIARFYFRNSRLVQVTLNLEGSPDFTYAFLVFQRLETALKVKYGNAIGREVSRGMLNRANSDWQAGRTNINLLVIAVGNKDATLNINYQVRIARDADKL